MCFWCCTSQAALLHAGPCSNSQRLKPGASTWSRERRRPGRVKDGIVRYNSTAHESGWLVLKSDLGCPLRATYYYTESSQHGGQRNEVIARTAGYSGWTPGTSANAAVVFLFSFLCSGLLRTWHLSLCCLRLLWPVVVTIALDGRQSPTAISRSARLRLGMCNGSDV